MQAQVRKHRNDEEVQLLLIYATWAQVDLLAFDSSPSPYCADLKARPIVLSACLGKLFCFIPSDEEAVS